VNWLRKPRHTRRTPTRRYQPALEPLEDRMLLSTYLVTNTSDSGSGSLRQAILNANAHAGRDTIAFNLPGTGVHTIALNSALPTITDAVVINGAKQPGFAGHPLIELDGAGAGAGADGLDISAGSSTVRGLVINRFADAQIKLDTAGGDVIAGNYLGTDATGTTDFAMVYTGVLVVNSSGDRIGGTSAADRNLIASYESSSLADGYGISLTGASATLIEGNFIGTDVTGKNVLPTSASVPPLYGVSIYGGSGNIVGGYTAGARNVIAGWYHGLGLLSSTGNTVAGNFIGTNAAGTRALGNDTGILLDQASSNTLSGNVVSGNGYAGFDIENNSNSNVLQNNLIGTSANCLHALGNGQGVLIGGSSYNLVGGPLQGNGNVIAANTGCGVEIDAVSGLSGNSSPSPSSVENKLEGNFIGTDRSGTLRLGNGSYGVWLLGDPSAVYNSYGNEVGGSAAWLNGSWGSVPAGYGNTIAFNGLGGVRQQGARMFNNPIRGNSIHDNGGLPISLDSQTPFTPTVAFASAGSTTTIYGSVSDPTAEELLIDFYANNPSEFGQARRYLGSTVVQASDFSNGVASFTATVGATLAGEVVTATATGYYGNTSQLATGVPAWANVDDPTGGYGILQTATGHEADGRAVVVAMGGDHAVYIRAETAPNSAVYGSWQSLGGWVQAVRVETDTWGDLQVLVLGSDNALWVNGQTAANSTSWSGWQRLGDPGVSLQQIEVKDDAGGLPVAFAVGSDRAVYYQWENSPGVWSGWYGLGGYIQSITLGRDFAGRLQVFALGTDQALYVDGQSGPNSIGFNGWQYLGGYQLQQLTVTNDAAGRLTVFALGGDHAVYYKQEDLNGNWPSTWSTLYGNVQSIVAGHDAAGRMEVVAVGFDGQIYAIRQTAANGGWGNWSAGFGGTVWSGTLTLGNEADGTLDVFAEFNNIDSSSWGYTRL
jgi:parallel beta-helix repeat protein